MAARKKYFKEESTMAKVWLKGTSVLIAVLCTSVTFIGCEGAQDDNPNVGAGHADGVSQAIDTPNVPDPIQPPGPPPNPNTITLAV